MLDDDNIVTIINYKHIRTRSSRFLPSSPENMAPLTPSATFSAVLTMARASFTAMQAQMIALQAQLSLLEHLHHSDNVFPQPDRPPQHKTSSERTIASVSSINTLPSTVHIAATACKCGTTSHQMLTTIDLSKPTACLHARDATSAAGLQNSPWPNHHQHRAALPKTK